MPLRKSRSALLHAASIRIVKINLRDLVVIQCPSHQMFFDIPPLRCATSLLPISIWHTCWTVHSRILIHHLICFWLAGISTAAVIALCGAVHAHAEVWTYGRQLAVFANRWAQNHLILFMFNTTLHLFDLASGVVNEAIAGARRWKPCRFHLLLLFFVA